MARQRPTLSGTTTAAWTSRCDRGSLPLPTRSYRYRVRATDDNGNRSVWKYGPRIAVEAHQESSSSVSYGGTWKDQSTASACGGAVKHSKAAEATLSFTGRNVAWVSTSASNRGKAEVYLAGKKVATIDLYSPQGQGRKVVYSANGLDPSVTHTLEVKALGTKKTVSGGVRVDVDAFLALR